MNGMCLRAQVEWLTEKMRAANFTVSCMHGDMLQKERDAIMEEFRKTTTRVLITTDVLARGIDVQQVSLVINYDLPNNRELYIHRYVLRLGFGCLAGGRCCTLCVDERSLMSDADTQTMVIDVRTTTVLVARVATDARVWPSTLSSRMTSAFCATLSSTTPRRSTRCP